MRLCRDCADVGRLATSLMARDSHLHARACLLCAEVCRMCADECDRHESDDYRACAKACRRFAAACETMVSSASKGAVSPASTKGTTSSCCGEVRRASLANVRGPCLHIHGTALPECHGHAERRTRSVTPVCELCEIR